MHKCLDYYNITSISYWKTSNLVLDILGVFVFLDGCSSKINISASQFSKMDHLV